MQTYTFMNKNTELFDLEMDGGQAERIFNFREGNHYLLPVFLFTKSNTDVSRKDFNEWWRNRRIPASRDGIKELLWAFRESRLSLDELAEKSFGLSLSDQYWIRPSEDIYWGDVNYFKNSFSEDIGNLLITGEWNGGTLMSPDNTSDGVVKKQWKIINGTRYLLKGSPNIIWYPEPFREVFASKIATILLEDENFVVPYTLLKDNENVYSKCPNFVTVDTEYVSFNQINVSYKRQNHISSFSFCRSFYKEYSYVLDLMLILDYIVLNEDRHFGNFGLMRSVDTGEFLKPAPVFDTGASLFYNSKNLGINTIRTKPFNKDFNKQIQYVDLQKYQSRIKKVERVYEEIFDEVFAEAFEDKERIKGIKRCIGQQIRKLLIKDIKSENLNANGFR